MTYRTVLPEGILTSSTIACVFASGSRVLKLTATIAIKQTGAPIRPNHKWSIPRIGGWPMNAGAT